MFAISIDLCMGATFWQTSLLFQTIVKGESVLLRKPPNLAAYAMCLFSGNVKMEYRTNAFCGVVRILNSASAAAKKMRPHAVGSHFFVVAEAEGFEPPWACTQTVFKTASL